MTSYPATVSRTIACLERDGFKCVACGGSKGIEPYFAGVSELEGEMRDQATVTLCADCRSNVIYEQKFLMDLIRMDQITKGVPCRRKSADEMVCDFARGMAQWIAGSAEDSDDEIVAQLSSISTSAIAGLSYLLHCRRGTFRG